jgi:nucleoside 2-deoxyribosyltransferase
MVVPPEIMTIRFARVRMSDHKTIYFAGAISGGRGDVALYREIIAALEAAGHHVLAGAVAAEHVSASGEALDSCAIFERDLAWIAAADVLVAEVSMPSTGVGYEIATARYRYKIPAICLYRPAHTSRCTAMVAGDREIELIEYSEVADLLPRLTAALAKYTTAPLGLPPR